MSDAGTFSLHQLVWAKMKGFSPWPGKVVEPPVELKKQPKKNGPAQCIFFFGSNNYAWIEELSIKPYFEYKDALTKANKSNSFKEALEKIEEYIKDPEKFNKELEKGLTTVEDGIDKDEEFNKLRESDSPMDEPEIDAEPEPTAAPSSIPRRIMKKKAVRSSLPMKFKIEKDKPKAKSSVMSKARSEVGFNDAITPPSTKRRRNNEDLSILDRSNNDMSDNDNDFSPRRTAIENLLDRPSIPPGRPDSPDIDIDKISQTLKTKNITPSLKKFGFLGLGIMGRGIVKNLLNSGHKVIVWNRTSSKCRKFADSGAEVMRTPSDVVEAADITFSCVSDPRAVKDMVFGNCGVLQCGSFLNKGYVEMTGIDSETSHDIADAIISKGGRYLEAQIQGSKPQAEEGTIIILAAGDRTLFEDCQTCFEAMGRNSFFLGNIGNASKMNLVLQTITGVTIASLAEALALADRAGLQMKDVLEVLELTNMSSQILIDKGSTIIKGDYSTQQPLTHMQKDLRLALGMADTLEQPLPLTSACNEVFKHAKRQGYSEHDASAVHITARL